MYIHLGRNRLMLVLFNEEKRDHAYWKGNVNMGELSFVFLKEKEEREMT